jgi:hypothetical protein
MKRLMPRAGLTPEAVVEKLAVDGDLSTGPSVLRDLRQVGVGGHAATRRVEEVAARVPVASSPGEGAMAQRWRTHEVR